MLQKLSKILFSSVKTGYVVIISLCTLLSIFLFFYRSNQVHKKIEVGKQAVLAMYNYSDSSQLDLQMKLLKRITTEEVFNQLTFDNTEKSLRTYLSFRESAVSVVFLKCTDTYILYSLNADTIVSSREFIFLYDVSHEGTISYAKEADVNDFTNGFR